jgi:inositol-pentakisphosphate 2-kinase
VTVEGPGVTLIEFKPKWLVQCSSAPAFSKRCRTCAKRARENYVLDSQWKPGHPFFCPLDLMARDDETALYRAAKAIFMMNKASPSSNDKNLSPDDEIKIGRIAGWAQNSNLLWNLRNLQIIMGSKSIFEADYESEHFRAAMTLRDCTMYLQIPDDETSPVIAKIGDLELKSAAKVEHWKEVERYLTYEGWYEGTEIVEDLYKQPFDCHLFPEAWTPYAERGNLRARW